MVLLVVAGYLEDPVSRWAIVELPFQLYDSADGGLTDTEHIHTDAFPESPLLTVVGLVAGRCHHCFILIDCFPVIAPHLHYLSSELHLLYYDWVTSSRLIFYVYQDSLSCLELWLWHLWAQTGRIASLDDHLRILFISVH